MVAKYNGAVEFVSEDWGESELARKYAIEKYPVVFVGDVLVAQPKDFSPFGGPGGKYVPFNTGENQAKFGADLRKVVDLLLAGKGSQAAALGSVPQKSTAVQSLPAITLQTLSHGPLDLKRFKGKLVLVEFWATWCVPCRQTIDWLRDVKKKYADKVEVIGLAVESEEKGVRDMVMQHGLQYPNVLAGKKEIDSFGGLLATPTLFVFDKPGANVLTVYGAPEDLHERVEKVLVREGLGG